MAGPLTVVSSLITEDCAIAIGKYVGRARVARVPRALPVDAMIEAGAVQEVIARCEIGVGLAAVIFVLVAGAMTVLVVRIERQAWIADAELQAVFDQALYELRQWHGTWDTDGFCEDNDEGGG